MEGLSELLRAHLLRPHGARPLPSAGEPLRVGIGNASNPPCGDELQLHLFCGSQGTLEPRFRARACSAVLAVASLCCETLAGKNFEQARAIDLAGEVEAAGGLPPQRRHALAVVQRALDAALDALAAAEADPRG